MQPLGPTLGNVSGDGGRIVSMKIIAGRIGAFFHALYLDPLLIEILNYRGFRRSAEIVDVGEDERCDQDGGTDDCADPGQLFADDAKKAHRCAADGD